MAALQEVTKLKSLPLLRALLLEGTDDSTAWTEHYEHYFWTFLIPFKYIFVLSIGNPLVENSEYRVEVLIAVRRLERLDKDEFTEEERGEAEEVHTAASPHTAWPT